MGYYNRYDDRNREARKRGERDAEWGYRSHQYDYDMGTERRSAYEDGYREERSRLERQEEKRREEERRIELARQRRIEEQRQYEQQQYYEEMERQRQEEEYANYCAEQEEEHDGNVDISEIPC